MKDTRPQIWSATKITKATKEPYTKLKGAMIRLLEDALSKEYLTKEERSYIARLRASIDIEM